MGPKRLSVDFAIRPPKPTAQPVNVYKSRHNAIEWRAKKPGHTFTGVLIGGKKPPFGGFGKAVIKTVNGKSVMTVSDRCTIPDGAQMVEYRYTLKYKTPSGAAKILDPTIRHRG